MFQQRSVVRSEVLSSRRTDRISIASRDDFVVGAAERVSMAIARQSQLLPYCLDFARWRTVFVGGVDLKEAQQAPFYYLHLRRTARSIVTVPWGRGALYEGPARAPIFVFSPGRCGSTLLSRILIESGVANVSEPDFYTQATSAFFSSPINPVRNLVQQVTANMGSDLCSLLAPCGALVAKLRAEACRAPRLLLQKQEQRTLFMTRDFEGWARSTGRAFRNGPRKAVNKYLTAMTCYKHLLNNSDCHLLRYEDLVAEPSRVCRSLGQFLNVEISPEAVFSAMATDSQQGTPLEQGARGGDEIAEQRVQKTLDLWNSNKVRRIRDRLGLSRMELSA